VLRKVGEEALELILAGLGGGGRDEVIKETADLWFFSLVALARLDLTPSRVGVELARRAGPASGREEVGC
jgi:phosphoribosyl-ATP pyrophosphohydrolase